MVTDAQGKVVTDPVQYLKNIYSTDPLGYNQALSHESDMNEIMDRWNNPYQPSNFLGGPGGVIGHQMQTVFDAANIQGEAQGGGTKYNTKQLPGQAPLPSTNGPVQGLQNADPTSPSDPINQWRKQQAQAAPQSWQG